MGKDTKFFDSISPTVDEPESKELEEPSMIENGISNEEDNEMKEDRKNGDNNGKSDSNSLQKLNLEKQNVTKTDSKVDVNVTPIKVSKTKTAKNQSTSSNTTGTGNNGLNGTGFTAPIPSNFICPISKTIMNDVVMAADGRMYDRANIDKYLETNNISPVKGTKMRNKNLMPFNELTDKITRWKMKNRVIKRKRRRKRTPKPKKHECRSDESTVSVQSAKSTCDEERVRKAEIGLDSSDTC